MKSAKITVTFTLITKLDPENYEGPNLSVSEMLSLEKEQFTENPELILDFEWDYVSVDVQLHKEY